MGFISTRLRVNSDIPKLPCQSYSAASAYSLVEIDFIDEAGRSITEAAVPFRFAMPRYCVRYAQKLLQEVAIYCVGVQFVSRSFADQCSANILAVFLLLPRASCAPRRCWSA